MRIWYASIFLSLLAGKLGQTEQSAATITLYVNFCEYTEDTQRKQTISQSKFAHVQKTKSETFGDFGDF